MAILVKLLSPYMKLLPTPPSATYCTVSGERTVSSNNHVTQALQELVAKACKQPAEFSLHSLEIGSAINLSAGGEPPAILQRQARWHSDAYKVNVMNHGINAGSVFDMLANVGGDRGASQQGLSVIGGRSAWR